MEPDYNFNYLMIGDCGVGKSEIRHRFDVGKFSGNIVTKNFDFSCKNIKIEDKICGIQIWDAWGDESFKPIVRDYNKNKVCIIIVYDITNRESFNNVNVYIKENKYYWTNTTILVLVGNKLDLVEKRQIAYVEGNELAFKNNMLFFETSAKSGENINEIFYKTAETIIKNIENKFYKNLEENGITFNTKKNKKVMLNEKNIKEKKEKKGKEEKKKLNKKDDNKNEILEKRDDSINKEKENKNKGPKFIKLTKESQKKVLKQMDYSIYKIKDEDENIENCFFCSIKYKNKNIPVMVTTNEIINEKYLFKNNNIKLIINGSEKIIEFGDIKHINKEFGLSIIEIKENKNIKINILELDDYIYKNDSEIFYIKDLIYIFDYNKQNDISVSYNIIDNINKPQLYFSFDINSNSSCSPIFNLSNNKLIGIYKSTSQFNNNGIFFKYIINEFIKSIKHKKTLCNEIDILIRVNKEHINKNIYFLNNYFPLNSEYNELKTELYMDNHKCNYEKYFTPIKEGEYNIKLKFYSNLTDCGYMFSGCKNIIKINFSNFNSKTITYMKYMFHECENLEDINLFSFDTHNVTDMSYMFFGCKKLKYLDLTSFDTHNVTDMSYMFYCCGCLNNLDLSSFNTNNATNMKNMFYECKNIKSLNISSFDTKNVNDMSYMFFGCRSLTNLDLSFFNLENVSNVKGIFSGSEKLLSTNLFKFKKFLRHFMISS